MIEAIAYKKIANPDGITNSYFNGDLDDFDLEESPNVRSDEMPLNQALKFAKLPSTDPNVLLQVDAAANREIDKLFVKYDTLREFTPTNPMDSNASLLFSLIFIKFKRDGTITARLAGCGDRQSPDTFGDDIHASTSDHSSWVAIFATYYAAAIKNNTLHLLSHCDFDITGAFLQCRLPRSETGGRQLAIKLPSSLPHRLAGKYVEVVGCLYGLKQSNKIFQKDLANTLAPIGFLPAHEPEHGISSAPDSQVYHFQSPTDPTIKSTLVMHVDDGQIFSFCPIIVELLKSTLELRYGALTWNDVSKQFTGTNITHHPSGAFVLDSKDSILKMLSRVGADNIPTASTPSSPSILLPSSDLTPTDPKRYQSLIGNLQYIHQNRHEIGFPLHILSKKSQSPNKGHLKHVTRIIRYLKGFPDTAPHYYTDEGPILCAHIDAAFANQENGLSTTCIKLSIGSTSAPFLSKTLTQDTVALDPATSEYYALGPESCKLILRYRNLLAAIGYPQLQPTPVFVDNQPAIHLATNPTISRKSRYLLPRQHMVRNCVKDLLLLPTHKNTNLHIADLETKPHGPAIFHFLTKLSMNLEAPLHAPAFKD
jgi:hypothetical protein